jgi:hypothetical protein
MEVQGGHCASFRDWGHNQLYSPLYGSTQNLPNFLSRSINKAWIERPLMSTARERNRNLNATERRRHLPPPAAAIRKLGELSCRSLLLVVDAATSQVAGFDLIWGGGSWVGWGKGKGREEDSEERRCRVDSQSEFEWDLYLVRRRLRLQRSRGEAASTGQAARRGNAATNGRRSSA